MSDPDPSPQGQESAEALASLNILVVDDSRLYRDGLVGLLTARLRPGTVTAADSLAALHTQLAATEPDVVLVNLASRKSDDLLTAVAERRPEAHLVVVGVDDTDERQVICCAEAGVSGYATRDYSLSDLLAVIEQITTSGSHVSPRVSSVLLRRVREAARQRRAPARLQLLTEREIQILRLIAAGLSNQGIADELTIELHTVKNHVHSVLTKLGCRRRGEAAALLSGLERSGAFSISVRESPILPVPRMDRITDPTAHASSVGRAPS